MKPTCLTIVRCAWLLAFLLTGCSVGTPKPAGAKAAPVVCPVGAVKRCELFSPLSRHRGEDCECVSRGFP